MIKDIFHKFSEWFRFDLQRDSSVPGISFAQCYKGFRALLTANNNALELMAEMEQTLTAGRPFGMAFVRGNCTALSVNVYKMILSLQEISNGKYMSLSDSFKQITDELETILLHKPVSPTGAFILPMDQIDRQSIDLVGEKMANLGEIRNKVGLKTPEGFVITPA